MMSQRVFHIHRDKETWISVLDELARKDPPDGEAFVMVFEDHTFSPIVLGHGDLSRECAIRGLVDVVNPPNELRWLGAFD